MALPLSQIPVSSSFLRRTILPKISSRIKPTPIFTQSIKYTSTNRNNKFFIITATKEENSESETVSTQQSPPNEPPPQPTSNRSDYTGGGDDLSELGSEIKKAMKEREEKGGGGFWGGVAEEIGEIEWPPFNKVLGTTGVVLGVIAGSSVVLLTVNAVLAELSDRVFAGYSPEEVFKISSADNGERRR